MRAVAILGCVVAASLAKADGLDDLAKAMGSDDAEQMALAGVLGKTVDSLKDPRSVQVVDAYTKRESASVTGCFQYRAKNGFGGYGDAGYAVWRLSAPRGKPALIFHPNSVPQWRRFCVGNGFTDRKDLASQVIERLRGRM